MEEKYFKKVIGNQIREIRLNKNLSQEDFAEKVGIHRTYLGVIERGEKNISTYKLYKILKVLDIDLENFFKKVNL